MFEKHFDICGDDFLDKISKVQATKANELDYIKLRNFCILEETINRMKRHLMGENIFKLFIQ